MTESPPVTDPGLEVFAWRMEYAVRLGYKPERAAELAESRTDLHEVEKLLLAGCRHDLAARIAWAVPGA